MVARQVVRVFQVLRQGQVARRRWSFAWMRSGHRAEEECSVQPVQAFDAGAIGQMKVRDPVQGNTLLAFFFYQIVGA